MGLPVSVSIAPVLNAISLKLGALPFVAVMPS
jgi:hypothetical protein